VPPLVPSLLATAAFAGVAFAAATATARHPG
jgi:hypothetical protein